MIISCVKTNKTSKEELVLNENLMALLKEG